MNAGHQGGGISTTLISSEDRQLGVANRRTSTSANFELQLGLDFGSLLLQTRASNWYYCMTMHVVNHMNVMAANFDLPLTPMSKSVHSCPAVLLARPQKCGCSLLNFVAISYYCKKKL